MSFIWEKQNQRDQVAQRFGQVALSAGPVTPVAYNGNLPLFEVSNAKRLRVAAGNAADTESGVGARKVLLTGVGVDGKVQFDVLATAGAAPSLATTEPYHRLNTVYVIESGTYSDNLSPSHVGEIVIESDDGLLTYATIPNSPVAFGRTLSASFSVPYQVTSWITTISASLTSNQVVDMYLLHRPNNRVDAAPYPATNVIWSALGQGGNLDVNPETPFGPFKADSDVWIMAQMSNASADVCVNLEFVHQFGKGAEGFATAEDALAGRL